MFDFKQIATIILFAILLSPLTTIAFEYNWEINDTPEGQESFTPIPPTQIEILGESVEIPNHSAAIDLREKYNIYVDTTFSSRYTYLLLKIINRMPHINRNKSLWTISPNHIHNDIDIQLHNDADIVNISEYAFTYSNPLLADIDNTRGILYSNRLFKAVIRYITHHGTKFREIRKIMNHRYGITFQYHGYEEITKNTTAENYDRFQEFKPEEIINLITILEQFPEGMRKIEGLTYLLRRRDGLLHPLYPNAGAVAWPTEHYIEFMENAFKNSTLNQTHRLIAHEKAHFLWHYKFDKQLKNDWTKLGGWYKTENDQWRTTQQIEFVTSYAHGINPNEDMAESIAFYITNPNKLKSQAPEKYEFIKNRIMHGTRYISKIREDLTFKVYNLWPDYIYPGKVVKSQIKIIGEPNQDKNVEIIITLHSENQLDHASEAQMRITSEKGTDIDISLTPINKNGNQIQSSNILKTNFTLSKFAASGNWILNYGLVLSDKHGNRRYTHDTDFGWHFHVNNTLADCEPPKYISQSMKASLKPAINHNGIPYQILTLSFDVEDKNLIRYSSVSLINEHTETYSLWCSAGFSENDITIKIIENKKIAKIIIQKNIPNYTANGIYKVSMIRITDIARNTTHVFFKTHQDDSDYNTDEPPYEILIKTTNPDIKKPELDVNNIFVDAKPVNPENLNGETIVNVKFSVKDNNSGYNGGYITLRDPNGNTHGFYIYADEDMYFKGDPTIYKQYEWTITLPEGSAPGIWGISEINITDKAQNTAKYDFTEIVQFDVDTQISKDLNNDGKINILDLIIIANNFGNTSGKGDVNNDNTINILDLIEVSNAFTK